jgi:hypothetical protein
MYRSVDLENEGTSVSNRKTIKEKKSPRPDELVVLWTSGDREVALKMVFMYTLNTRRFKWGWKNVTLVVWGPSSRLLSADTELQEYLSRIRDAGVKLLACKKCSDMYGVSDNLRRLGIEVKYMGKPLTEYLRKDNCRVITI